MKPWILYLLIFPLASCDQSIKHLQGKELGLSRIERKVDLKLGTQARNLELFFIPKVTAEKYDFRLFFPEVKKVNHFPAVERQMNAIISELEGFQFTLIEKNTGQAILHSVIKRDSLENISFNSNPGKPLSCWLAPHVELQKGTPYVIKLHIPPKKDDSETDLALFFTVGIGRQKNFL
ncbi:MAG: hypothetical protein AAFR61_31690 [Bacteroidota bacterium]